MVAFVPIAGLDGPLQHGEMVSLRGKRRAAIRKRALAVLGALFGLLASSSLSAAAEVSQADLVATLRSLAFLSSLQNRSAIVIGVIYNGADPVSRVQAGRVAGDLSRLPGPGSATITAVPVAVQDLAGQHFDSVYLLSLPSEASHAAGEFVRRQNVVSVSSDPQCLEAQSCVLLVQARTTMSVVLDTALAKQVGAKFSTVFTMLVKRK